VTKVNEINLNELLIIHSEVSCGFYRFMIHSIVATLSRNSPIKIWLWNFLIAA
jgi:hypothetical protein